MPEKETIPEELRCHRTDGRQWRCSRRAMEGKRMCELHHLQLSLRQQKQKVPESLKLVRTSKKEGGESAKKKRKRVIRESEAVDEAVRKMKLKRGDAQLELIRMVLKREVEKRKKPKRPKKRNKKKEKRVENVDSDEEEMTRVLPNGVMAISSCSPSNGTAANGCDVKVGAEPVAFARRFFRSKNIEPLPLGTKQVVPYKGNLVNSKKEKRKRCHWCGEKDFRNLIICSSCQRQFFCVECIEERHIGSREEVEMKCPVCRGRCGCKTCSISKFGDAECKDLPRDIGKVDRVLHLHYLICMLLPVLRQMNEDQTRELEREAKIKGQQLSELQIQTAESTCNKQHCCNCKASIVDLHRSCTSCLYTLCLSCCWDLSQGSLPSNLGSVICNCSNERKSCVSEAHESASKYCASPPNGEVSNGNSVISCPPAEVGGCGNGLLDLRSLFPSNWTKNLEISAEEIVSSYDLPETLDSSPSCSLCLGSDNQANQIKHLQEASRREDSSDNFLYHPTIMDVNNDSIEHFQKHWVQGHPVIVQNVQQRASDLSWDPITMFCTYLKNTNSGSQNEEVHKAASRLDWFEVEIGIKQLFLGSLRGQTEANTCNEKLKLKGWLSSPVFQEHFPAHYAEIIDSLPLPHYMDPNSGLLNIAAKLPDQFRGPDLGPRVYISYSSGEELVQADFVTKLRFDLSDVVNILVHASDAHVTTKQICNIRKLMKKHKTQDERTTSKIDTHQIMDTNEKSALQNGRQNRLDNHGRNKKRTCDRVTSESRFAAATEDTSRTGKDGSDSDSDSDSESLKRRSGSNARSTRPENWKFHKRQRESCNHVRKENLAKSCGAQWDVFRRQDVPKLLEYLRKHSHELNHTYSFEHVSHPILEENFFLDTYQKIRLKEEFEIEPWTFEQHVGEAVIIPAGCPYQARKLQSCVNLVMNFISPENVTECIQRTDELRLLPGDHKAKSDKLEVKKMAIHSISAAIEEIRDLTC